MAVNLETQQLAVARNVEEALRTLAHSTRTVPNPQESYDMLGELRAAADSLEQVLTQLGGWHWSTESGTHYPDDDAADADGDATAAAADELRDAARAVARASAFIGLAHAHNGVVRWYPAVR